MAKIPRNIFEGGENLGVHHQTILMKPFIAIVTSNRRLVLCAGFLADPARKPDSPRAGVGFDPRKKQKNVDYCVTVWRRK